MRHTFVVFRMTLKIYSFVILCHLLQLFSVTIYKVGKYMMPSMLSSVSNLVNGHPAGACPLRVDGVGPF